MNLQTNSELHLLIIWQNARYRQTELLQEVAQAVSIVDVIEMHWSEQFFSENMTRFYGQKLPSQSHKEKHCGRGPFLLVICRDEKPEYLERDTISRAVETVNVNMFDLKSKLRRMSGGGHRIHATNDPIETAHDLALLLGQPVSEYLKDRPQNWSGQIRIVHQDLAGADGWESAEQMFSILNQCINYAVLRNYNGFPRKLTLEGHEDVDFITDDYQNFIFLVNGRKVTPEKYRVQHEITINGQKTFIDVRHTKDGYYDPRWAAQLLKDRKLWNGLYIAAGETYQYSLVYHALIHKWRISDDYLDFMFKTFETKDLDSIRKELDRYMSKNGYQYTEPKDLSVGFNGQRWTLKRQFNELLMKFARLKQRVVPA